jgi:predicted nucleic acid-binding protein
MIVADSSALIEYYRSSGNAAVQEAVATAVGADLLAVNGIIQVEVVGFARDEDQRRLLESDFRAFHWLELSGDVFDLATRIGYDLRRRGRTVPATDLIIAAHALSHDAELLHVDNHFDDIAEVTGLIARNPTQG